MATSNQVPYITYGGIGAQGSSAQGSFGQVLTSNGMNGSSWMNSTNHAPANAVQIGSPDPVVTFNMDGNITTKAGTITAEDWITVIQTMKRLIMDMSKDQEMISKYPYIQDVAHTWFMNELKGKDNGKNENE